MTSSFKMLVYALHILRVISPEPEDWSGLSYSLQIILFHNPEPLKPPKARKISKRNEHLAKICQILPGKMSFKKKQKLL